MYEYEEEILEIFLKMQGQLFDEQADEFLDDCMAAVVDSVAEVREYFEESGADVDGMSDEELLDAAEVFAIPDGRFLIVEG